MRTGGFRLPPGQARRARAARPPDRRSRIRPPDALAAPSLSGRECCGGTLLAGTSLVGAARRDGSTGGPRKAGVAAEAVTANHARDWGRPVGIDMPASLAPRTAALGLRRRVLVVDDNRDVADSTALLLQTTGFEVQEI